MTLWAVRAGKYGDNEAYALEQGVVVIGWDDLGDISEITERSKLVELMRDTYPENASSISMWTGEVWAFKERIIQGDWVVLPLKTRGALAIGKIDGPYQYVDGGPDGGKHQRRVHWMKTDISRTEVDQDILFSLGSVLTVFRVSRNDAEARLIALVGGKPQPKKDKTTPSPEEPDEDKSAVDIDQIASDQIVEFIGRKFKGHDLARLVAALLTGQGYKVLTSGPGADGGIDILAGTGAMGFDSPRLAVQVKSSDAPVDVSVLRELQGVMPGFGAEQGLIVAWGGFKESVLREARQLYFRIRLWDAGALVSALQENYQKLPEDVQAELPLKRSWILVSE